MTTKFTKLSFLFIVFFSILFSSNSFSTNKLGESFKGATFPPTGWRSEHVSGAAGGGTWFRSTSGFQTAPACAQSNGTLLGDNWLITKRITPSAGDSLVFWVSSNYVISALGRLEVKVSITDSSSGSFGDFVIPVQISLGLLTPNVYYRYAVNLTPYAGIPIYIGFRHIEVAGLFGTVRLDGIAIGGVDLDLRVLVEGHAGENFLYQLPRRDRDTVTVSIHEIVAPFNMVDERKVYLDTFGVKIINYNMPTVDRNYYIRVTHHNSIRTWSRSGGDPFDNGILVYDFTTGVNKAYGNNMKMVQGFATMLTGDPNQDLVVDLTDLILIYNDGINFTFGSYLHTDLNWEEFVDLSDLRICYNNSIIFAEEEPPQ